MDKINELLEILTLDSSEDIFDFFNCIGEKKNLTKHNIEHFKQLLEMIGYPLTIVCEREYVDKIYRDTYYEYFASKHLIYEKNCKRLAFFIGEISAEKFYDYNLENTRFLQQQFVGISIIKPVKVGKIGKTLLDPLKIKIDSSYIRTTPFDFILLGHSLKIDAFPYSSQDSETMTCAETTVWNILEYYGTRYPEYRTILPSQLLSELEKISYERILPSRGLDYYTISELLKTFGFAPRLYSANANNEDFQHIFHYYVESGIPLAVGVEGKRNKDDIKHSIVCIGHGKKRKPLKGIELKSIGNYKYIDSADLYDEYVIMDDNQLPYRLQSFHRMTQYDEPKVVVFTVPLYKRIFLEAKDASIIVKQILENDALGFAGMIPKINESLDDNNPIVLRLYLTTSRKYKSFRINNEKNIKAKNFYARLRLPRFIWVAEISTFFSYENEKIYGEIIIDATSSRMSCLDSLIMIRYLSNIGYRMPDEDIKMILGRICHEVKDCTYPYEMYKNNLIESGG